MIVSLATARVEAANSIQKIQKQYKKKQHDKQAHLVKLKIGYWVLVYFPKSQTVTSMAWTLPGSEIQMSQCAKYSLV